MTFKLTKEIYDNLKKGQKLKDVTGGVIYDVDEFKELSRCSFPGQRIVHNLTTIMTHDWEFVEDEPESRMDYIEKIGEKDSECPNCKEKISYMSALFAAKHYDEGMKRKECDMLKGAIDCKITGMIDQGRMIVEIDEKDDKIEYLKKKAKIIIIKDKGQEIPFDPEENMREVQSN